MHSVVRFRVSSTAEGDIPTVGRGESVVSFNPARILHVRIEPGGVSWRPRHEAGH